jgi:hypothetical protein
MDQNRIQQFIAFVLRHFIASIISIIAAIMFAVIVYFILFFAAIITNTDLGGPLALPLFIVIAGILSLIYTTLLLFPAVLIAELISQRLRTHQLIAQILLSTISLALLIILISYGIHFIPNYENYPFLSLANYPVQIFLVLCIPLGFYFCITKIVQAITTGIIGSWKKSIRKEKVNSQSLTGPLT